MKIQHTISPILIIVIAVLLRLLPHPANVAPIASMALFGGAYLNKRYALLVPLVALFISDIFLGFHQSMVAVYFSFFLTGCIGLYLARHKTPITVILASVLSSVLFFLITNCNFWYVNSLYPKAVAGLAESYMAALPFFRNTLIGDLLYTGIFFGAYEWIRMLDRYPGIAVRKERN